MNAVNGVSVRSVILCEKPSVAKEVAGYLGATFNKGAYYSSSYIVCSALGHLFTLDHQKMGFKDRRTKLYLPPDIYFKPSDTAANAAALKRLKYIASHESIDKWYNFCDPDIEGQRIADNIFDELRVPEHKRFRLWTSDVLSKSLVLKLLQNYEPDSKYRGYFESSKLRAYSDLTIGFNCSPLYSRLKGMRGLSIGRCQTPILIEICRRYQEIVNFVPETYYRLQVELENGTIITSENTVDKIDGITLPDLHQIDQPVYSKPETKTTLAPPLYNKASLLVDANRRYGINAKVAAHQLQDLYQDLKITSYPRTPSCYLDEAEETKSKLFDNLKGLGYEEDFKTMAGQGKLIFNEAKVEGHYALIILNGTSAMEHILRNSAYAKILTLIRERMLCRASPPVEYLSSTLSFSIELRPQSSETWDFKLEGRKMIKQGWTKYKPSSASEYNCHQWVFTESVPLKIKSLKFVSESTKPPAIYTSGSLIKWMEKVGIGAPSTYESYPPLLIDRGYLELQKGDKLTPTKLGLRLAQDLKDTKFSDIAITRDLEQILKGIITQNLTTGFANNKVVADALITSLFNDMAAKVPQSSELPLNKMESPYLCVCGSKMKVETGRITCPNCGRTVFNTILKRPLSVPEMTVLASGEEVFIKGFTSKNRKKFDAYLKIDKDGKPIFRFRESKGRGR